MVKCLVVGHGPSYRNYEFIRNFDGLILSVDICAKDLIENEIIPDYQLFSETHETITKNVSEWISGEFIDDKIRNKMTVVHRSYAIPAMYNRVGRMKLKSIIFDADRYGNATSVNNVGLYSIVFACDVLNASEVHIIGLDYGNSDEYKQSLYDGWIASTYHYYRNKPNKTPIIDHSGGNFPPYDHTLY